MDMGKNMGVKDIAQDPFDSSVVNQSVADEAVIWFTRLQSGDITQEERFQFETWRARSPLHAKEFARINVLWDDLDGLKSWADNELAMQADVERSPSYPPPGRVHKISSMNWAGGLLSVMLLLLAGTIWLPDAMMRLASDYRTDTGEQKSFTLADGSQVVLDADSALSVEYSTDTRKLILHQGRAYFIVSTDKQRPFIIETGGGKAQALGTEFEVHQTPEGVDVTVFESTVQISLDTQVEVLGSGQRLHYSAEAGVSKPQTIDLLQAGAWQRGKLIFTDRPLSEVITEINRYRQGVVILVDDSLGDFLVSGVFDLKKPDVILQALTEVLPIRHRSMTPLLVLLDRS